MHLNFNPDWPDIKLAQAAIVCQKVSDLLACNGHSVQGFPVMLAGDWNSLWRKYKPDAYDRKVLLQLSYQRG